MRFCKHPREVYWWLTIHSRLFSFLEQFVTEWFDSQIQILIANMAVTLKKKPGSTGKFYQAYVTAWRLPHLDTLKIIVCHCFKIGGRVQFNIKQSDATPSAAGLNPHMWELRKLQWLPLDHICENCEKLQWLPLDHTCLYYMTDRACSVDTDTVDLQLAI